MAYPVKTFAQITNLITQEIRNETGLSVPFDSDAGIRADGTASVVEGLYHHQTYIQKQLFVATADEPFLYIHADELGRPRLGGTQASGTVSAVSNIALTIVAGSKLTDGKSHYWTVVSDTELLANTATSIDVVADRIGASWNFTGTLLWISPPAGLSGTATEASIGGGTDEEELEDWRARLLQQKQLGLSRDRAEDLEAVIKTVVNVKHVYVYPKRRGLGSLDVAITAVGNPPTLPSEALITSTQLVLDTYAGFWADCRVYSPTEQLVPVSAVITGTADLDAVKQVIRDYFAELAPVQSYQVAILTSRIIAIAGVTDVVLSPSSNIVPTVDPFYTKWLRLGTLTVSAA
ncbi:baseplate J/gp47 family protein [Acinetobacter junii]|uniref:baseplate J/gp47 family protein n=1 Tax=Acinetobacter junii TaxID=40215 RepID=UPI0005B42382|nr:baseplate J/gp47 family protein [Acinetobacter junii]